MIGTIDITVNAEHPNVPLSPVFAWRGSASRINVEGVPCLCGSWYVSAVSIAASTPDGKTVTYPCQRTCNGIWSVTIDGTDTPGKSGDGITITATDEEGKDFVLGRGDLYILDGAAIPSPGDVSWTVRLLTDKPEDPKDGDAYFSEDGTLLVYSGGEWRNTMPSAKVPTKVSELENDAGYITEKQVKPGSTAGYAADAEWADKAISANEADSVAWDGVTGKPTKLSEFDNDMGFISASNNVFLPTTGGTLTGELKVGDKGHIGRILVQNSKGETKVRINGEQADGGTSYGGEIVVEGEPGAGGGGRLRVMNGAYGGGELDILGAKGGGQATFKMSCATGENTGDAVIRSGSNSWEGATGSAPSIVLGDNTENEATTLPAEITIGSVKVRATLATKADKTSLDALAGKVDTLETLGRNLSQNKADKATPSASAALLADNAVAVVDGSTGGDVAVSFKAPSGNALRYCELMLTGVASDGAATLVLPAGTYQFADGADSVSKGNSHFCFAEYARGKWLVTRQSTTEKAVEEAGA